MFLLITEALEAKSIPTYIHSEVGEEGAKAASKVVVDSKVRGVNNSLLTYLMWCS